MTTSKIQMSGHKAALVVLDDQGVEVGTIAKAEPDSAWTVYQGVGWAAVHIGNRYSRKAALALLAREEARRIQLPLSRKDAQALVGILTGQSLDSRAARRISERLKALMAS